MSETSDPRSDEPMEQTQGERVEEATEGKDFAPGDVSENELEKQEDPGTQA